MRAFTTILPIQTIFYITLSPSPPVTIFYLTLSPSSPLFNICPPAPQLLSFEALREYILYATSCFLACSYSQPQIADEDPKGWTQTIQPNILRKRFAKEKKSRQLSISLLPLASKAKQGIKLKVMWEWIKGDTSSFRLKAEDEMSEENRNGTHQWVAWDDMDGTKEWGEGEAMVERSLEDVVESAGK
jgi:mediator of RNA polymerase II transcription subunit 17